MRVKGLPFKDALIVLKLKHHDTPITRRLTPILYPKIKQKYKKIAIILDSRHVCFLLYFHGMIVRGARRKGVTTIHGWAI